MYSQMRTIASFVAIIIGLNFPFEVTSQEVEVFPPGHYIKSTNIDNTGREIVEIIVPGKKPVNLRMPIKQKAPGDVLLNNVPAYDWSFGCSATAAAMMAGYYDNYTYPDIYTGPANGGIAPMDNSIWGTAIIDGETRSLCPLSATRLNLDGRSTRGHVDDYWVNSNNSIPDPYITNGWPQHTYNDCTGDFMKTNQSAFGNSDGSTTFTFYVDGGAYSYGNESDGILGLKLFFESKSCPVTQFYNQYILGHQGNTKGFTFNDYTNMIDRGMPVLIQVAGHTMLGCGYNLAGEKVLLHDTWDYSLHEMTWGGDYAGMQHYAVSVIAFPCQAAPTVNENFSAFSFPTCWQQTHSGGLDSDRWSMSTSNNAGGLANEMQASWIEKIGISRLVSAPINTVGASQVNLSFKTFYDDYGNGAVLKIQSSSDLINWTDEEWSYNSGLGNIDGGTEINTLISQNLGTTTYVAWVIEGDHYQFDYWFIDDVLIEIPANKQLQLGVFLEGLYNGATMNKASNASGFQFGADTADLVTLELHSSESPYSMVGLPILTAVTTNGIIEIPIPASINGSYFIVVKHRNSIETWSALPVSFASDLIVYNFSDAAEKAYGSNLKLKSGKYLIFSGDIDQNGIINNLDMSSVFNRAAVFGSGYTIEDLNGDGCVDATDMVILDNNAASFISVAKP